MSICIKEPCRVRLRCGGELDINRIDMTACYGACHDGPGDSRLCWLPCGHYSTPGADHPFDIVEVLAPLKPVVIDGPGEYWCRDKSIASIVGRVTDARWTRAGFEWQGKCDGVVRRWKPTGQYINSSREVECESDIVAKVAYRTRPLTPDEAFKLLGKKVLSKNGSVCGSIKYVGEEGVVIVDSHGELPRSFGWLMQMYETEDGSPLSVTEPIPFAG